MQGSVTGSGRLTRRADGQGRAWTDKTDKVGCATRTITEESLPCPCSSVSVRVRPCSSQEHVPHRTRKRAPVWRLRDPVHLPQTTNHEPQTRPILLQISSRRSPASWVKPQDPTNLSQDPRVPRCAPSDSQLVSSDLQQNHRVLRHARGTSQQNSRVLRLAARVRPLDPWVL